MGVCSDLYEIRCLKADASDLTYFSSAAKDLAGLSTLGGTFVLLTGTNFGPSSPDNSVYAATFSKTCRGCTATKLNRQYVLEAKHINTEYNVAADDCKVRYLVLKVESPDKLNIIKRLCEITRRFSAAWVLGWVINTNGWSSSEGKYPKRLIARVLHLTMW